MSSKTSSCFIVIAMMPNLPKMAGEVWVTNTKTLRSRMKRKLSCPVLKTSGAGDSLAEFNCTVPL
jgi:hypothetical protein